MDALVEQTAGTLAESAPLADGTQAYRAVGCWSIRHANTIYEALPKMIAAGPKKVAIDLKDLAILDTSGAWLLCTLRNQYAARGVHVDFIEPREEHTVLLERIARASEAVGDLEPVRTKPESVLDRVAESLKDGIDEVKRILSLLGALVSAFAKALVVPARFRFPALVTHMMRTGLTAVPIITLMSFVIGAIIAQQGAYQLSFFGADVMAVDFVAVLVTRNLGVLLTAIMVAGRSGSAYTAEIGSMKMREEIDALKVIGLDPVDVLLFPRIMALVLVLPLLTVIADFAALVGAQLALWIYIDMSWQVFLERARDVTPLSYFMLGVVKAPFMALIIGLIAMSEGLKVAGSSESLSRHTTIAVVKSIFMVIVVDGIFAVISANLDT